MLVFLNQFVLSHPESSKKMEVTSTNSNQQQLTDTNSNFNISTGELSPTDGDDMFCDS